MDGVLGIRTRSYVDRPLLNNVNNQFRNVHTFLIL